MLTDPKKTKDEIVQWIRDYFAENGPECSAVVGISGGKDSTIVAALCVEALGKDRVFGVMMPNGIQADIKDSIQVVKALGISSVTVNISGAYSKLMAAVGSAVGLGNIWRQRADQGQPPSQAPYGDALCRCSVSAQRRTSGQHLQYVRGLCGLLHQVRRQRR